NATGSAGSQTVTVTLTTTLTAGCRLDAFTQVATSDAFDTKNTASGTSATMTSPSVTTTTANDLTYLASFATSTETASPAAPWNAEAGPTTAGAQRNGIAYQNV